MPSTPEQPATGLDATVYVCADLEQHNQSPNPVWIVSAILEDVITAKAWCGRDGIIVPMAREEAKQFFPWKALPSQLVQGALAK